MRHRSYFKLSVLATMLAMISLAGCELFNGDDDDDRDRDRTTVGSTTGVPKTASVEAEGRGTLSFLAPSDGTVYLWDREDKRLVDTQNVRRGERYTVDLDKDLATLDGKPVYERNLEREHEHRIYFDAR